MWIWQIERNEPLKRDCSADISRINLALCEQISLINKSTSPRCFVVVSCERLSMITLVAPGFVFSLKWHCFAPYGAGAISRTERASGKSRHIYGTQAVRSLDALARSPAQGTKPSSNIGVFATQGRKLCQSRTTVLCAQRHRSISICIALSSEFLKDSG